MILLLTSSSASHSQLNCLYNWNRSYYVGLNDHETISGLHFTCFQRITHISCSLLDLMFIFYYHDCYRYYLMILKVQFFFTTSLEINGSQLDRSSNSLDIVICRETFFYFTDVQLTNYLFHGLCLSHCI